MTESTKDWLKNTWKSDGRHILFLLYMYSIQGVVFSLYVVFEMILVEKGRSFREVALFASCGAIPYSLRLAWGPIVDTYYFKKLGRSKSWIVPGNLLIAGCFWFMAHNYEYLVHHDTSIWALTGLLFVTAIFSSTTDMALDGWGVTMLQPENYGWQMTCNNVGFSIGIIGFMFCTLSLTRAKMVNALIRKPLGLPLDKNMGLFTMEQLFYTVAILGVANFICVIVFQTSRPEPKYKERLSLYQTFDAVRSLLRNEYVRPFLAYQFFSDFGSSVMMVINAKLVDNGVAQSTVALLQSSAGLVSLLSPFLFIRHNTGSRPFTVWIYATIPMLVTMLFEIRMVKQAAETQKDVRNQTLAGTMEPGQGVSLQFKITMFLLLTISTSLYQGMRASSGALFVKISDPTIASTSYTLFMTVQNLGRMLSNTGVLYCIDRFSKYSCALKKNAAKIVEPMLDWNTTNWSDQQSKLDFFNSHNCSSVQSDTDFKKVAELNTTSWNDRTNEPDFFSNYNCTRESINATKLAEWNAVTDWNDKKLKRKCEECGVFMTDYDAFFPIAVTMASIGIAYVFIVRPYLRYVEKLPPHVFYVKTSTVGAVDVAPEHSYQYESKELLE